MDDARARQLKSLVVRAQLGDMGAFAEVVRRFQRMAWGYAYARLGDAHAAEDVAQEAFLDAYLHLGQLRTPAAFPSWFRTVLRKHSDRMARTRASGEKEYIDDEHSCDGRLLPHTVAERNDEAAEVRRLIGSLPEGQRIAATLHYMDDCSPLEIAEFLNVGPATVRKRLIDARRSLSRLFPKEDVVNTERTLKALLEHHMAPSLVRKVMKDPTIMNLQGETREMTALFIDVIGCTRLFEEQPPDKAIGQLNEYLGEIYNIILDHEGFMDKIIGDEVMAFWGAPLHAKDHAVLACEAALDMSEAVQRLRTRWKDQGRPDAGAGIGINSGDAVIGNMGPPDWLQYTPMGEAINLASQVEGETRKHGVAVVITEFTEERLHGMFDVKELGSISTRSRPEPVRLYELVRRKH